MEMLPCGFYSMFTSCAHYLPPKRVFCAFFVLCVSLAVGNGLNHSRSTRGGAERCYSWHYMGTNRLGDSWPNVVIVGDKETGEVGGRWGQKEESREREKKRQGREGGKSGGEGESERVRAENKERSQQRHRHEEGKQRMCILNVSWLLSPLDLLQTWEYF